LPWIADVGSPRSEDHKLITGAITFELTNLYAHGTSTSRTDRRTDGQLTIVIPRDKLLPSPPLSERRYCVVRRHAVTLCMCVCPPSRLYQVSTARRIGLGGEGNALYPVLSSFFYFFIRYHRLLVEAAQKNRHNVSVKSHTRRRKPCLRSKYTTRRCTALWPTRYVAFVQFQIYKPLFNSVHLRYGLSGAF